MPIHPDWASMIKSMAKKYKTGPRRCYPRVGKGKKICAPAKAWSVFYAKVNKDYGPKAYMKPRTRKAQESLSEDVKDMVDELERDIYLDWLDEIYELNKK